MRKLLICLCLMSCLLTGCAEHANASKTSISASASRRNERIIYNYLTKKMKLSPSAACGIIANIYSESSFRPNVENDSGHYGLCQWGGIRRKRFMRFCRRRGYNYKTVNAQIRYINFELRHYYPKVLKRLKSVRNNSRGAYKAGYYFCYYYEAPGSRGKASVRRGNLAKKYFKKYQR